MTVLNQKTPADRLNPDAPPASAEAMTEILRLVSPYAFNYAHARVEDLDHPSIEAWLAEAIRGEPRAVARFVAKRFGIRETEAVGIVHFELRRSFTARRVAALPPALLSIFQECGDPNVRVLSDLIERIPEDERNGWTVARAVRRVHACTESQAHMQRERHAREIGR